MLVKLLGSAAVVLGGLLVAGPSLAAEEAPMQNFRPDFGNVASMQKGARDFMAYCSGCHSMKYLRYSRMADDLGIPENLLKANLMFGTDKTGDTIKVAMPADSEKWFGRVPPDLSLEARARGPSWIYTYLQSFYLDEKRPLGVNNTVLPNASMPHVLWELQGWQKKTEEKKKDEQAQAPGGNGGGGNSDGGGGHGASEGAKPGFNGSTEADHPKPFEQVSKGSMTPEEYKEFVGDIVNFMDYAAEPGKRDRVHTGFKVILFLFLLLGLTYLLKKEFWRDVH